MNKESGNVFFYILLAIALFAALSYAVSQGNRGNTSTMTDQQAKLAANEIIEYGQTVANAVQKLRLRGCTDTQISFENDIYSGYINPNAPTDNSCHVFDQNGANINYARSPDPYFFPAASPWRQSYGFMMGTAWDGNGKTCLTNECVDLLLLLEPIDQKLCEAINTNLSISGIPEDVINGGAFVGTYNATSEILGDTAISEEIKSKNAACLKTTAGHAYLQVLIAR